MPTITIAKAQKELGELANRAAYAGERIVLSKHGKKTCALVSMESLQILEDLERREDEYDAKIIEERKEEPVVSWESVKADMAKAREKARKARAAA